MMRHLFAKGQIPGVSPHRRGYIVARLHGYRDALD